MMSLLLLLSAVASAEADEAKVFVQVAVLSSSDAEMDTRLRQAAACQPDALGGSGAVPVAIWTLEETPWLSVISAPSILTLDGQAAQIRMRTGDALTEFSVTPTLDEGAISLSADLRIADEHTTTEGAAEVVVASGEHMVWPVGDVIVAVGAYALEMDDDVDDIHAAQKELWAAHVAPMPRGRRARLRAVDAALAACR